MAVGKSVVGQRLAQKLKRAFVDLDLAIETREGMKVREIFSAKGESYFRKVEKELLREALIGDNKVIATGGGAVMDNDNLCLLRESTVLIELAAKPQTILRRAAAGENQRPLLQRGDKLRTIKELLSRRQQAYSQAHFSIDTDGRSVDEVVAEIIQVITKGKE
jgi:shikimate kinase